MCGHVPCDTSWVVFEYGAVGLAYRQRPNTKCVTTKAVLDYAAHSVVAAALCGLLLDVVASRALACISLSLGCGRR